MPFSHSRAGQEPALHCTGGFTLNRFTVNGFTVNPSSLRVNGFTPPLATGRGGFIPPVDALRHGRSRKPFRICSYEKCARNSPGICSYKSKDLNSPGICSYKKHRGVPPSCFLASVAFSHSQRRGAPCPEYPA